MHTYSPYMHVLITIHTHRLMQAQTLNCFKEIYIGGGGINKFNQRPVNLGGGQQNQMLLLVEVQVL